MGVWLVVLAPVLMVRFTYKFRFDWKLLPQSRAAETTESWYPCPPAHYKPAMVFVWTLK